MILAAAQIYSDPNDTTHNVNSHAHMIRMASENGAGLILFPEMSLTGYERINAKKMSFQTNDARLDPLRQLSCDNNIIVVAGAPLLLGDGLAIGAFVLLPDQTVSIYVKQYLHTGEEEFFVPSFRHNPLIELEDEKASIAICADIDNPRHPENAQKNDTTLYLASLFFSTRGIPDAQQMLSQYAKKFRFNVLMANYCGKCWGIKSGGRSAFWNKKSQLVKELEADRQGLLLIEKKAHSWNGRAIYL